MPRPPATLATLPHELLVLIADSLPLTDVGHLRLASKALDAALAEVPRSAFHTVSFVVSEQGLATLAAIANSPLAGYVRHIAVSRHVVPLPPGGEVNQARAEQFALLGLDADAGAAASRSATFDPVERQRLRRAHVCSSSPDTPLARRLGAVLASLPSLESASVGPGYVPLSRRADLAGWTPIRVGRVEYTTPVRSPFGLRALCALAGDGVEVAEEDKEGIVNAMFRALLFALVHAHAAGGSATTLRIDDSVPGTGYGLDDAVFSLSAAERDLASRFIHSLRTLDLRLRPFIDRAPWTEEYDGLHAFLGLCTGLVELGLRRSESFNGDGNAVTRLVATPPPVPSLEVLKLQHYHLPPGVVINLLSQWSLREVVLRIITLTEDVSLACTKTSGGTPMVWDTVLRAVSARGQGTVKRLELGTISEMHAPADDDEDGDDEDEDENEDDEDDGPEWCDVKFNCPGLDYSPATAIIRADTTTVVFPDGGGLGNDAEEQCSAEADVFLRAAGILREPAVEEFSDTDYGSDEDEEDGDEGDEDEDDENDEEEEE